MTTDSDTTQFNSDSNLKLMAELWPTVVLLNGLSDPEFQWQSATGRKEYIDAFGGLIPKGQRHYRKGEASVYCEPVRLSVKSMQKLLFAMFEMNRGGMRLAMEVNAQRIEELREMLTRASRLRPE